jgi:hypothetical protein
MPTPVQLGMADGVIVVTSAAVGRYAYSGSLERL